MKINSLPAYWRFFVMALSFVFVSQARAQCPVTAFASPQSVACGDTIILTAIADGCKPLDNNFNNGSIGPDWQATNGAVVNNGTGTYACVGPSPEGSQSLWMGATVAAPRQVATNFYDLTQCAAIGGNVCFWMKFAKQGGPSPCEGIDLPEEGVALQYSINNGATWVNIKYYEPNGGYDPVMINWKRYCLDIPAVAMTASTAFRWYQAQSSGAGYDTWGLDDMVITLNVPSYTFDWDHDAQGPSSLPFTPPIVGVSNSTYTVTYTNGIETCTSSVDVQVAASTGTLTANPTQLCPGETSQLVASASLIRPVPDLCGISITGCQGVSATMNIGTGTVNETSYEPLGIPKGTGNVSFCGCTQDEVTGTVVGTCDNSGRTQMIIQKSELPAFFKGGQIYNMQFNVSSSDNVYQKFTIKMGCTNQTEFSSDTDLKVGLVTVYNAKTANIPAGAWKLFDFDNHFDWNGLSNIIIEFSWSHADWRTGNVLKTATTNFSTISAHSCISKGATETNNSKRFQLRPSLKLGYCYRPLPEITYTWSPTASLSNSTISNPFATPSVTTTYEVVISDKKRPMCDVTKSILVEVVRPDLTITPSNPAICPPATNVVLTANATPSAGGTIVSYAWSPATNLSSTTTASTTASPTVTTTYTCTIVDSKGCTNSKTVTVTVGAIPAPTAVDGSRCGMGTVNLSITGCSGTPTWYAAATGGTSISTSNPFVTPSISSTTTYYASCASGGCESPRVAVKAIVSTAPKADFNYTGPYCKNGTNASPTFTGGGTAGSFTSNPVGLIFVSSTTGQLDLTASTAGSYTVTNTVTGTGGCSDAIKTASVTISPLDNAGFNYTPSTFCKTGTNPVPTITGIAGGTFSAPPEVNFVSTSSGEINLTTTPTGTHTITYTTPGPCVNTSTRSVTINPAPVATFEYSGPYCQNTANPSPTYTGGGVAGSFTESTGNLRFISASTGQVNLSASIPGTYTVTNTIPMANGCAATSATASITITKLPVATFSYVGSPFCQNAVDPSPTYSGGGSAGTFSSTAGLSLNTTNGQVTLATSTAGTYTVTNTITGDKGCPAVMATSSIKIMPMKDPEFIYSPSSFCKTGTNPTPTITSGDTGGEFTSTPGLYFVNSSTGQINLAASSIGSYTITFKTSDPCASSSSKVITITNAPVATFKYTGPYCKTGANPSPTFTGGGTAGTFTFSPAGLSINSSTGVIDLALSTAGTYSVTNTISGGGCAPTSAKANVTITAQKTGVFTYAGPYCKNAANPTPTVSGSNVKGTFTAPAGLKFISTSTGQVNLATSTTGTYTVTNTITGTGGCPNVVETATITINPMQNAGFTYGSSTFCKTGNNPTVTITGVSGGTFSETGGLKFVTTSPQDGDIDLNATPIGEYTITYTTAGPCASSSSLTVNITDALDATFEYNGPYCQNDPNPTPTYPGSGTAGTFTADAGLVFVNTSTGEVNLALSTPGDHSVTNTIPESGSCSKVEYIQPIHIDKTDEASISYAGSPFCQSGTADPTPTITGISGGKFSSTTGLDIDESTGKITLSNSTPETYTVSYLTSGPCPSIETIDITITKLPVATFSFTGTPYCQDETNPFPTLDLGSDAGTFSCLDAGLNIISPATGEINLSASTTDSYVVTNTIPAAGGCPEVDATAPIEITPLAVGTFFYEGPYCQNEVNPTPIYFGGGIAGTFTSSSTDLKFANTSGTIDLALSKAGQYTVTNTIDATGGCPPVVETADITITEMQSSAFTYAPSTFCQTGTDPVADITGVSGGTFSSTAGLVFLNTSTGEIDVSASSLGDYTITYTTAGPCITSSTFDVNLTDAPTAYFNYVGPYCKDETNPSATITSGSSAGEFTSTTGLVFANDKTGEINLTSSTAGTYTVTNTIAESGGCAPAIETASVIINAVQDPSFSYASISFCKTANNQTPTSVSAPGGTFTSSGPGLVLVSSNTGEIDLAASSIGSYTVSYITPEPCAKTSDVPVDITLPPSADFTYAGPYCQNGITNPSPTMGSDATKGTFSATPEGLVFVSTTTGQVDLTASTPGPYTVTNTIAQANGCAEEVEIANITITPLQDASFDYSTSTYCQSGLNPTPIISGAGGGTFSVDPTGLNFVSTTTGEINLATSTPENYMVTYTTPGPCVNSLSKPITITSTPEATFTFEGPYCLNGTNPKPSYTGSGVAGNFTATPFGLKFVNEKTGEVNLALSSPGTYTITNSIPAANGCVAVSETAPITLTALPKGKFSYVESPFCHNDDNSSPTYSGGGQPGTFSFSPTGLIFMDEATAEIDIWGSNVGTYTITNSFPANGGCPAVDETSDITINPIPTALATNNSPKCEGSDIILSGSSNAMTMETYQWSSSNGFSSTQKNPVILSTTMADAGQYDLTVVANNCMSQSAVTIVELNPLPTVQFEPDVIGGCIPLTVEFTNNTTPSTQTAQWTFGDGGTSTQLEKAPYKYNIVGCFDVTLTVTSTDGCTSSSTRDDIVCIDPNAIAEISVDNPTKKLTNPTFNFLNNSVNATNYLWYFGDGTTSTITNPYHEYENSNPGIYTVSLVAGNAGQCNDSTSIKVKIEDELIIYVPNTFTPDGDKLNQVFKPVIESGFQPSTYDLYIFNRWGEVVFHSGSYTDGWDGTYQGNVAEQGTYIWKISFKSNTSDKKYIFDGSVNMIK
jgi:gliding motility-associated-like protein